MIRVRDALTSHDTLQRTANSLRCQRRGKAVEDAFPRTGRWQAMRRKLAESILETMRMSPGVEDDDRRRARGDRRAGLSTFRGYQAVPERRKTTANQPRRRTMAMPMRYF